MADKTIGELPVAAELYDDSLLVVEQQRQARSVTGALVKQYAEAAAKGQADAAAKSAEAAKTDADRAAEKAKDAADVALHPPILKDGSDHWWTWDTGKNDYVDSGIDAGVSVQIGKTTTGPAGSAASVKNTGTNTDPVFEFTIPQGVKGDKGDKGEKGEVGPKGDTGPTGPVGPASPVSSVNGQTGDVETRALQFDIKLPASGWSNGSQTVKDARFVDGENIEWDVDVKGACIPWDGVTITEGQMAVQADIVPMTDMTWTVTRREVRRDG